MKIFMLTVVCIVLATMSSFTYSTEAEQIYVRICIVCHGDDGSGNMPGVADLVDSQTLFKDSEQEIVARMKSGMQRSGGIAMPPKGGDPSLTDDQLLSALRYVKQLVKQ